MLSLGEHSDTVSPEGAQELLEHIPDSRLATVPGTGHMAGDVFAGE